MPLERRMIVTVLRSEIHINSAAVSTALEVVGILNVSVIH